MHFPDGEIDSTDLNLDGVELLLKHCQEIIDMAYQMVLETLLADLLMHTLIEPFNDCVFNFADALQVGEVFLEFVAIWGHAFESIIVSDVFLFG